ncbi:MAG: FkbM family methyltransferase, partial [Ilumatobacteraceae bacterium]
MNFDNIESMPLIIDVGMNNGRDSLFYLQKGFRVVAIEANPALADAGRELMASYVESGQLVIEDVGLGVDAGEMIFFVNIDNDHWSSFNREWGTRNGTRYYEIPVQCVTPQSIFEKYGMPYYLKIDIEGSDITVVRALSSFMDRPRYISIEENQTSYFAELWAAGFKHFKLVNQRSLSEVKCPYPPLEGKYVDAAFDGTTSGPFGEEAPGTWVSLDIALELYLTEIRSPSRG